MSSAFTHSMASSPSLSPRESWRSSRSSSAAGRMNPSKFVGWRPRRRPSRSRSHSRSPSRWNNNGFHTRRQMNDYGTPINRDFADFSKGWSKTSADRYSSIRKSPLNGAPGLGRDDGKSNRVTGALLPQSELFAKDIQQRQRPLNPDRHFNRSRRFSKSFNKRSRSPPMNRHRLDKRRPPRLLSPQCQSAREHQEQTIVSVDPPVEQLPECIERLETLSSDVQCKDTSDANNCFVLVQNLPATLDWDQVLQIFSHFHAIEVCYACDGWRIAFPDATSRDAAVQEMNGFEWQSHHISVRPWASFTRTTKDSSHFDGAQATADPKFFAADNCIGFIFEALLQTSVEQAWRDVIEAPVFRYLEEWSGRPRSASKAGVIPTSENVYEINVSNNADTNNMPNSNPDLISSCVQTDAVLCSGNSLPEVEALLTAKLAADTAQSVIGSTTDLRMPIIDVGLESDLRSSDACIDQPHNVKPSSNEVELATDATYSVNDLGLLAEGPSSNPEGLTVDNHAGVMNVESSAAKILPAFNDIYIGAISAERSVADSSPKSVPMKNKRGRPPGSRTNHSVKAASNKKQAKKGGDFLCSFCGASDDHDQMAKCWNISCQSALHIYCMAPPLRRVPRQWACDNHIVPDPSSMAANFDDDDDDDDEYVVKEWRPSRRLREQREVRPFDSPSSKAVSSNPVFAHQYGCARTAGISLHLMNKQLRSASIRSLLTGPDSFSNSRRSNRADRRRLSSAISSSAISPLPLNSLISREKKLQLFRSAIHAWGVRTCEPLYDGDVVIEYIGECISANIADIREKRYERIGIGSSYFFKIDDDLIIDATKKGNLARYINHSCLPNCRAKVVNVGNTRRIAIYAKQFIPAGEELCYDYKFPSEPEEDKIPCWCGTRRCRGYLN